LKKAAKDGIIEAQCNIGSLYRDGQGVSQDYKLAMDWYQKAASKGNDYAQCNIGEMYEDGDGVTKSVDTAIEWYKKAVENNNEKAKVALERLTKQQNDANEEHKGSIC
jgi:TPR repeat protein